MMDLELLELLIECIRQLLAGCSQVRPHLRLPPQLGGQRCLMLQLQLRSALLCGGARLLAGAGPG